MAISRDYSHFCDVQGLSDALIPMRVRAYLRRDGCVRGCRRPEQCLLYSSTSSCVISRTCGLRSSVAVGGNSPHTYPMYVHTPTIHF